VQVASTGADAERALIGLFGQRLIILLDLRLPDVVDLSLLQSFRAERPDAPVLVLSAWASNDLAQAALAAGATGVMRKPFDVSAVVAAITAASAPEAPTYTL